MSLSELKQFLLWSTFINYGILLVWFAAFVTAHDALYRLHSRWFKISVDSFDKIHYAGMAVYKIGVMLLNLVPCLALCLASI